MIGEGVREGTSFDNNRHTIDNRIPRKCFAFRLTKLNLRIQCECRDGIVANIYVIP